MACRNEYKYDKYEERYLNTSVVKYYTENCFNGKCTWWDYKNGVNGKLHIRILNSLRIPNEIEGGCPMNCDQYLNRFCPYDVIPSYGYCQFFCPIPLL